jgi:trk system potassium uptake protein TrkA
MIAGAGRIVYFVATSLLASGHELTLVIRDRKEAEQLAQQIPEAVIVVGNGSHPDVLEDAEALGMNAFVALAADDATNLIACQQASRRFHIPRTVAVVSDPRNEDIFHQLGVEIVICPTAALTTAIEQRVVVQQITESIALEPGKLQVTQLRLGADDPSVGRAVRDLELPADSILAAIVRNGEPLIPRGDTVLDAGDRVVVVSLPQAFKTAAAAICGLNDIPARLEGKGQKRDA